MLTRFRKRNGAREWNKHLEERQIYDLLRAGQPGRSMKLTKSQLLAIRDWLRNESEDRMKNALARRSAVGNRNATAAELKAEKRMAERMLGRKLDLVSTKPKDNITNCDMQERIASKYETEARQLALWADVIVEIANGLQ